jgi:hypothetical protein
MRHQAYYGDLEPGVTLVSVSRHRWEVVALQYEIQHVTIRHCETGREDTMSEYKFNRLGMRVVKEPR